MIDHCWLSFEFSRVALVANLKALFYGRQNHPEPFEFEPVVRALVGTAQDMKDQNNCWSSNRNLSRDTRAA
jgi:hypothetical protein